MTSLNSQTKYRPVLTASQILHILGLAKTEPSGISPASLQLISTLSPFAAKIANNGIVPAYTTSNTPQQTTLQKLGGEQQVLSPSIQVVGSGTANPTELSKEVYWLECYTKFLADPTSCTLQEIEASNEHRYINDLMTPEEETAHEQTGN